MPATRSERRAWLTWSIPALLFLIAFFHRVAPGVMAKDLMQAFDATAATIGLLSATYFYSYAALMVPAGVLVDAWGVRAVVAVGGFVMGASVTFIGALKVAALWFPATRFGLLSAVTATVGIVGALAATAPLAALARGGVPGGLRRLCRVHAGLDGGKPPHARDRRAQHPPRARRRARALFPRSGLSAAGRIEIVREPRALMVGARGDALGAGFPGGSDHSRPTGGMNEGACGWRRKSS